MKEQKLEDSLESSAELFELPVDLSSESEEQTTKAPQAKSHLTELRRRIEERLESKRIELEYDWDDFDDLSESSQ